MPNDCAAWRSAGLLVSDEDDARLVELRRRDEQLAANGWSLYAAAYHSLTRRLDTDLELAEDLDDKRRAKLAGAFAKRVKRGGPPPPAFHRSPLTRSVHDLPLAEQSGPLFELLQRRRTGRTFDPEATMTTAQLSTILRTVFGTQGLLDHGNGYVLQKKTSPSGGGLHPIEAYPLIRQGRGARARPLPLRRGAACGRAARAARRGSGDGVSALRNVRSGALSHAQVAFVLTARFRRNFWKYWVQKDQYGVLLLDAGHLSQTLYLVATELGLDPFRDRSDQPRRPRRPARARPLRRGRARRCAAAVLRHRSRLMPRFKAFSPRRPG